ncbi:MAG TPA: hypothetical protein VND93_27135 [Myxococcales bacterium]|nr:hypothetical protein [Myxococcales bacterium]
MRTVALGIAAIGAAAAISSASCVQPVNGRQCFSDFDCPNLREYCELSLDSCITWVDEDPSCNGGCAPHEYCSRRACWPRFSAIQLTSPDAGAVVGPLISVAYAVTPKDEIAAASAVHTFEVELTARREDGGGISSTLHSSDALTGTSTIIAGGVDASVLLGASIGFTSVVSEPVPVLVDQTR